MLLGIIGKGHWGDTYARTLARMGVDYWQESHAWVGRPADGFIVSTPAETHFGIAKSCIESGHPVLIEKPMCVDSASARTLLDLALQKEFAVVFTGHTRLYSSGWRTFKRQVIAEGVRRVVATAGGGCKIDPLWDWGPHLVAMCIDLGFDPLQADLLIEQKSVPLQFRVNDKFLFVDEIETPSPLENLLCEFLTAISLGAKDLRGIEFGLRVVDCIQQISKHGPDKATGIWKQ